MLKNNGQAGDCVICEMEGVRGGDEGCPVFLAKDGDSGRLVVRGFNEGGFACVDIDIRDLLLWLSKRGTGAIDIDAFDSSFGAG